MTYSIVALDRDTGAIGCAVQSRVAACAATVLHADAGVGAVCTQSFALKAYGPRLLARMREGQVPDTALQELVAADEGEAVRQVGAIDAHGRTAVHTGGSCIPEAGHRVGEGYAAQANMMARNTVWDAMAEAFEGSSGELALRLLAALDAAEAEGGDVRGMQGAGLLVVSGERDDLADTTFVHDLRVDDHPEPLRELRRLLDLRRAFGLSNEAQEVAKAGDGQRAVALFHQALALSDDAQIRWSLALALAIGGQLDAARAELDRLGPHRDAFVETTRRLGPAHLEHGYDAVQQLLA
jgi:uncharacterized Ntn-hydrolase superfamily protein